MLNADDAYADMAVEIAHCLIDYVLEHLITISLRNHPETQREQVGCDGIVAITRCSGVEETLVESLLYF